MPCGGVVIRHSLVVSRGFRIACRGSVGLVCGRVRHEKGGLWWCVQAERGMRHLLGRAGPLGGQTRGGGSLPGIAASESGVTYTGAWQERDGQRRAWRRALGVGLQAGPWWWLRQLVWWWFRGCGGYRVVLCRATLRWLGGVDLGFEQLKRHRRGREFREVMRFFRALGW